jgi:ABC-type phosphate transport system substrate-binding protein
MRALRLLSLTLTFALLGPGPASGQAPQAPYAAEGYLLIVNEKVPLRAMSRAQVTAYFLKRSTRFNDVAAHPVDQPEASPVRAAFSQAVLHKPPQAVEAYWRQRVASGRDVPPPEKRSDAEVLAYVRDTEGAIGYVSPGADTRGVRVLMLLD